LASSPLGLIGKFFVCDRTRIIRTERSEGEGVARQEALGT